MKNSTLQPYIWVFISGFAFSWMVAFAKLAGSAANWQIVAIARCAIPLILIALWARWDGARLVIFGSRVLWIRSIAGSCSLVGTFYVLGTGMPITDIYTISNIFPIWVALLSWPMFGRFPSGIVWVSIFSSIAGVALIQGAELQGGHYGALIVVAISLFTAIAMLGLNQLKGLDPRAVVVHFSGTALVVSLVCLLLFGWDSPPTEFTAVHLAELIGIGVTASVGQFFLTKAFTAGDPARMSVATLSQFIFVLILDVVVLNNPLDATKLWGIPLILGPTCWLMMQRVKTSTLVPDGTPAEPAANDDSTWTVPADSAASNDVNG